MLESATAGGCRLHTPLLRRMNASRRVWRTGRTMGKSVPGRRVVHPPAGDHRRHDLHLEIALEGILVEDDEIRCPPGDERPARALVVREPRRRDARRMKSFVERQPLVLAPVALDGGDDA